MQIKVISLIIIVLLLAGGFLYYQKINSDEYLVSQAIAQKMSENKYIKSNTVSNLRIKDGFARASISSPGLDPAQVILQKKNGKWEVIRGPGTGQGPDDSTSDIPKDL